MFSTGASDCSDNSCHGLGCHLPLVTRDVRCGVLNRFFSRAFLTAVAVVAALATVVTTAQAAGSSGWRIVATLGSQSSEPVYLTADAATGPSDAWMVGDDYIGLKIEQWLGTKWRALAPPHGFASLPYSTVSDYTVAASSATNMWTFPEIRKDSTGATTNYALEWNGTAWTTFSFGQDTIDNAAVFSPTDVLVFGSTPGHQAFADYYNGQIWQQSTTPAFVGNVSVLSPDDIWALGVTLKSVTHRYRVYVLMHWNGTSWSDTSLPTVAPIKGYPWYAANIVATSDTSVWISELETVKGGIPEGPPGVTLLNWNGSTWTQAAQNTSDYFQNSLAQDGHGGLWLFGFRGARESIVHYAAGQWKKFAVPTETGFTDSVGSFLFVPGTADSEWATGNLTPASGGTESAILQYGP
jgi:hypothetical protein